MIEFIIGIFVGIGLTWGVILFAMRNTSDGSTRGGMAI